MIMGIAAKKRIRLKPCLHCGSRSIEKQSGGHLYWMVCLNCKATGPEVQEDPESAWNARIGE